MRREERRRRFQEALLNTLYPPTSPPPPSPPPLNAHQDERGPNPGAIGRFDVNLIPGLETDDYGLSVETSGPSSPASDEEDGSGAGAGAGAEKLSRAQRKRLRKRRLKEDASRRGNIIGPLLPAPGCTGADEEGSRTPGVRLNACDHPDGKPRSRDDDTKRTRRRRMAKRITIEENQTPHQK